MRPLYIYEVGKNQILANWIAQQQGHKPREWRDFNTLSFRDNRGLLVGLLYTGLEQGHLGIHCAARPHSLWCYPDILFHVFAYPFLQLGVRRVTAPVKAANKLAVGMVRALGFVEEGRLREAEADGGDALIFGMLRRECRWIPQEVKNAVAA